MSPQQSTVAEAGLPHTVWFMSTQELQTLLDVVQAQGYEVVGPRVDQQAIVYDQVDRVDQLPVGWTDVQEPGQYRLQRRDDDAIFGYVVGPHSWKKYLFPPLQQLMTSKKTADGWTMHELPIAERRFALLGVRACELAAIAIQDRVFMNGEYCDPVYSQRRQALLIIAVNCTQAASTCFCTSMNTGPRCTAGFDLALTEIDSGFLVEVATERGQDIARQLPLRAASEHELSAAQAARQRAVDQIQRHMPTEDIHDKLLSRLEHPQWSDVAQRCLGCANCTLVCPTCFCHSVDEVTDLTDQQVVRQRRWDSCFNFDFSHASGGSVRGDIRSRYRQWLTHKLASWIDQFGSSGCVGCGRCITWCPVGIDLTQEVATLCAESTE
ncbi:MAG: 4Fe-4S dicluster domain-containing protein [Pirellulaceae bacterium]|nr:4Fe-4S dicluster domain-containing protein [Pirellulaceae bacterium]